MSAHEYVPTKISWLENIASLRQTFQLNDTDLIVSTSGILKPFVHLFNGENGDPALPILYCSDHFRGEPEARHYNLLKQLVPQTTKRIIAIGGGSVLDCAKVMAYYDEFQVEDIIAGYRPRPERRYFIAVPTTCGTGSEVTPLASAAFPELKTKKGFGFDEMYPNEAVIIPEVLSYLPDHPFATSSMDALVHAVESYLSPKATVFSEVHSIAAIQLILKGYQAIVQNGFSAKLTHACAFLTASTYAGMAFAKAGCAAVHALSYPLGGLYHVPHGEANQAMFMAVLNHYRQKKPIGKLNQLEDLLAMILNCESHEALDQLKQITEKILPAKPLSSYGVKFEELNTMAQTVFDGQQRLLVNNYVPFSTDDILAIYQKRYA